MKRKNIVSKKSKISVVIPTYNGEEMLVKCLDSLGTQKLKPSEVIVIDNGSEDKTSDLVKVYPIRFISLDSNYGFSYAVNLGIKKARFEKIFVLNNDVVLDAKALYNLSSSLLEQEKNVVAVVPLVFESSTNTYLSGSYINELGQAFQSRNISNKKERRLFKTFLATGPAILFRKSVFEKVGYLEQKYFAYGEDVDWSFRAQLCGFTFICEPKAKVTHIGKATSSRNKKLLEYLQFRNAYVFILRCFPKAILFENFRLFKIMATNVHTFLSLSLRGYFKEALTAELWILKNLTWIFETRKEIMTKKVASTEYLNANLSPKKLRIFNFKR